MRRIQTLILATLTLPGSVAAQRHGSEAGNFLGMSKPNSVTEAECDYDKCALRFTLGLASWHIVQGTTDKEIGHLGYFSGPNIEKLVMDVPEAVEAARRFRSHYRVSSALVWGGGLIATTGVGFATANNGNHTAIGVGVAGLAVMAYGVYQHTKSFDLLSRSIWLYNRSLKR